jgi:XTP/dITP diphosphohydrolase
MPQKRPFQPSRFTRVLFFATGNKHKLNEASQFLKEYNIVVKSSQKKEEIQHNDLKAIASYSLINTLKSIKKPVIVEDAGLFIDSMKGFPGPYSSYVFHTLGNDGLLKLLKGDKIRQAEFRSIIAYGSPSSGLQSATTFLGIARGKITTRQKGSGFGFDPIFLPNSAVKTFGEMSVKEKNRHSHRSKSLKKFANWYIKRIRV